MSYEDHFWRQSPINRGFDYDERWWVMAAHASVATSVFFPVVGPLLGPLLVIHTRGKHNRGVEVEATEALNFGVTTSIAWMVVHLIVSLSATMDKNIVIAEFLLWLIVLILVLIALMRIRIGKTFRYPINLRLIGHPKVRPQ